MGCRWCRYLGLCALALGAEKRSEREDAESWN